ncbi:Ribokinase-like protein [Chytriomyces cf. hyalinus JEL632]|nr:Ribokinase-like protein [Chytriomyces cf. hyalinus JEL632]
MKLKAFVSGACYQDVILRVDSYPQEDAKVRAQSVEKRRGGNGANVLQVLSQFQPRSIEQRRRSTGTTIDSTEMKQLFTNHSLETHLIAVLAGVDSLENVDLETSFIINDLRTNTPLVSLAHCVFRGAGYSEPTAWIVATGASRTIINHTTLPELTAAEFKTGMAPVLDQNFNDANVGDASPSSLWFHFEGRNVSEMEQMVDWLIDFTISVEFEKPNRPGLDNLLAKADLLFFSKWYAEGRGFPNAPTGFLDNIRRECKQGAILFLTWSEQGCFFLVNDLKRPAQTHHVPAPQIFPVDTIGAGDTFAAGILYSMGLQKWDTRRACEFSVRLATAKCAQVGFDGLADRVI